MKSLLMKTCLVIGLTLCGAQAPASDLSFVGNFTTADDVQLFNLVVGAPSTVTLRTWSYAGGTNAQGDTIARGGFDPILALFDSSGARINQNDDGGALVPADLITGQHYDTYLGSLLNAGAYAVSVMAYSNFSRGPTLADGFFGGGSFTDATGNARDTHWAFDVLNVDSASVVSPPPGVPEPASWAMMITGLGAVGGILRRRRSSMIFGERARFSNV